jgi:hypothetical protein
MVITRPFSVCFVAAMRAILACGFSGLSHSTLLVLGLLAMPPARQAAGIPTDNALTPAESAQGWRLLFDGRALTGWQPDGQAVWHVEDGTIAVTPDATHHGDLRRAEALVDY